MPWHAQVIERKPDGDFWGGAFIKKLKLIYNPFSGDKAFRYSLDPCIQEFQTAGYETHIFRSAEPGDIARHISEMGNGYDALVVSGGDGTLNIAVNAMMKSGLSLPLGIIPSGTANDFASFLKIPKEPENAAAIIASGKTARVDVGLVNDHYFINVCGAGLWTNISQQVDPVFKDTLGKLAYYIKGIEQLPSFVPLPVRITNSVQSIEAELFFFIVLNSMGTGGFEHLSADASIDDGLFDFIAFKSGTLMELAVLFVKVLTGDFLNEPGVIFFRDDHIKVELLSGIDNPILYETDIDGEIGPDMPIEIYNLNKAIEIFVP